MRIWNYKTVVSFGYYAGTTQLKLVHAVNSFGLFEPDAGWPSAIPVVGGSLMDLDLFMNM